jgi:hypothetical protein
LVVRALQAPLLAFLHPLFHSRLAFLFKFLEFGSLLRCENSSHFLAHTLHRGSDFLMQGSGSRFILRSERASDPFLSQLKQFLALRFRALKPALDDCAALLSLCFAEI